MQTAACFIASLAELRRRIGSENDRCRFAEFMHTGRHSSSVVCHTDWIIFMNFDGNMIPVSATLHLSSYQQSHRRDGEDLWHLCFDVHTGAFPYCLRPSVLVWHHHHNRIETLVDFLTNIPFHIIKGIVSLLLFSLSIQTDDRGIMKLCACCGRNKRI